ncbi:MAG: mechanosensitive ion channel family protein [Kineosporiaceae bacterium]|nr:mechanosensitive ion channel family protein [Kineosporiaceae bacterium]
MTPLHQPWTGTWAEPLFGPPLEIAAIVLVGLLVRLLTHRLIDRVARGIAAGTRELARLEDRRIAAPARLVAAPLLTERREQRARTTASVLKSLSSAVVGVVVLLTVMDVLSIPVAPLLASAGIVGVAVGFGAQSLVKDVISGLFMIVEDQYGVGDDVDLGGVKGEVEAVGLRVTRIRGHDGVVWYVRNGEVLRVGNASQGWSNASLDIALAYGGDVEQAERLVLEVARDLAEDDAFRDRVLDPPVVVGVEQLTAEAVVIRLEARTQSGAQTDLLRELRRRIKSRLDTAGIALAPTVPHWTPPRGARQPPADTE